MEGEASTFTVASGASCSWWCIELVALGISGGERGRGGCVYNQSQMLLAIDGVVTYRTIGSGDY